MSTASFTATEQALTIGGGLGANRVVAFQFTGTFTATATFESTVDGTNWVATGAFPISESGTAATTAAAAGIWRVRAAGLAAVRARCSAFTSGPMVCTAEVSDGTL